MDQETRDLCLELAMGDLRAMPIVHGLTEFVHFKKIAKWLVKNKLTGSKLIDCYIFKFKRSKISLVKYVMANANKDYEQRKIYAKDIITGS